MNYRDVFKSLELGGMAEKCAFSDIEIPVYFIEQNPEPYGFLPAMIPIWREDVDFVGYWYHWFTDIRSTTLVQQSPELSFEVKEVARDFTQLLIVTLFRKAAALECLSDFDIKQTKELGVDLEMLKKIHETEGDAPNVFLKMDEFKSKAPLYFDPSEYNGDFPCNQVPLSGDYLRNTCTVEFADVLKSEMIDLDIFPPWFHVKEQAPLFYDLLKKKDYLGAWMSLNSNGWDFFDAKKAILMLADEVNDKKFSLLAEVWASNPHERYESY